MTTNRSSVFLTSACMIALLGVSRGFAERPSTPPAISGPADAERRLTGAKRALMSADYRADLAALAKWRDLVAPLEDDPVLGYLAHYWSGFASWRLALNGASHAMKGPELKSNLELASAEFDAAVRAREDFADACAAAASVNGWLATFYSGDSDASREHIEKSRRLLARAKQLEPANPRVLWVEGGAFLFTPAEYGGNQERALEIYRQAAAVDAPASLKASPLPDWGKAEAVMALAYAHLNQATPDLAAAEEEAREALRLQPDWSYVRDVLRPQIAARNRELEDKDHPPRSRDERAKRR